MSSKNYEIYDEEYQKVLENEIEHDEAVENIVERTGESEREVRMEIQAGIERTTLDECGLI